VPGDDPDNPKRREELAPVAHARLFKAMVRLQSWITRHASFYLGPGVSPFDFLEPLERRLAGRITSISSEAELDRAIRINVRYLVREQRRDIAQRAKRSVSLEDAGDVSDSQGLAWAERILDQQTARELLELLDEEVAGWAQKLYGLKNEELRRSDLAKSLGISRNTLDARISREYRKLRAKLTKSEYAGHHE
jgi:hypothetical protein